MSLPSWPGFPLVILWLIADFAVLWYIREYHYEKLPEFFQTLGFIMAVSMGAARKKK